MRIVIFFLFFVVLGCRSYQVENIPIENASNQNAYDLWVEKTPEHMIFRGKLKVGYQHRKILKLRAILKGAKNIVLDQKDIDLELSFRKGKRLRRTIRKYFKVSFPVHSNIEKIELHNR